MEAIFDNDLRSLSDNELIYNISNKANQEKNLTFEEFINQLTPSKKSLALNVIELYRRSLEKKQHVDSVKNSVSIYNLMYSALFGLQHEEFWVVFLNQGNRPIKQQRFSRGGLTQTVVDIRLILKEAFLINATGAILVHNHPSGNVRPSMEDDKLTEKMKNAFKTCDIRLLDHVIFSDNNHYSYADESRL